MSQNPLDSLSAEQGVECVNRMRAGDTDAFQRLLNADHAYLMLVAGAELDSDIRVKASASDVVQETMLEAQQSVDGFRGNTVNEFRAWLHAILRHNLHDVRRRFVDADKRTVGREVAGIDQDDLEADRSDLSPLQQAICREQSVDVLQQMHLLTDDQRELLRLPYWEQQSYVQIGQLQGRSSDAVRKALFRAVEALTNVIAAQPESQ